MLIQRPLKNHGITPHNTGNSSGINDSPDIQDSQKKSASTSSSQREGWGLWCYNSTLGDIQLLKHLDRCLLWCYNYRLGDIHLFIVQTVVLQFSVSLRLCVISQSQLQNNLINFIQFQKFGEKLNFRISSHIIGIIGWKCSCIETRKVWQPMAAYFQLGGPFGNNFIQVRVPPCQISE